MMYETGDLLRRWLIGQGISMALIGSFTYVGLLILGVPIAFVLALFAGLAGFLPYLGPIIGAIPMVLVAGGESFHLALMVVGLYALIQFLESYLLTPLIQARAVSMPPAVVILSQLVLGAIFGLLGLALATPLVAAATVPLALSVRDRRKDKAGSQLSHKETECVSCSSPAARGKARSTRSSPRSPATSPRPTASRRCRSTSRTIRCRSITATSKPRTGPPEKARAFKALLGEYQGVFIASPEYNSSITPLLKNTLDWVTRVRAKGETGLEVFKIARVRHLRRLARLLRGDAEPAASPPDPRSRHRRDGHPAADRGAARDGRVRGRRQSQGRRAAETLHRRGRGARRRRQEICRAMTLPRDRLIVALDVPNVDEAKALIETLGDSVGVYKIGLELLFSGGFALAQELARRECPVFVDAKLLDIEATVERATAAIARMGIAFLTVHALDKKTLAAAVRGRGDSALKLLGVTVLTNLAAADLIEQGCDHPLPSWCCIGPSSPRRPASTV